MSKQNKFIIYAKMWQKHFVLLGFLIFLHFYCCWGQLKAKDNGDIFVDSYYEPESVEETTVAQKHMVYFAEIGRFCNVSFSIPMEYMILLNNTAELPNITDKTGMVRVEFIIIKLEKII